MEKNLGHATAYGYAKSKGYSGTEEEFAQLMADYASVGQSAAQSAEQAAASATSASGSAATASQAAQTATSKASEAVTAAGTATTKASEASQSASTASAAATSAGTSAQTATTAAATATAKASEASESAATASTAKTDAESARDAAAQSASEAAESARTLTIDTTLTQAGQAADAKVVGDNFDSVKSKLNDIAYASWQSNARNVTPMLTQGYVNADGTIIASQYYYTNLIPVEEGDFIRYVFNGEDKNMCSIVAYTDGVAVAEKATTGNSVKYFTVPSEINGIVINEFTSTSGGAVIIDTPDKVLEIPFDKRMEQFFDETEVSATSTSSGYKLTKYGHAVSDATYKLIKYQVTAGKTYKIIIGSGMAQFQDSASVAETIQNVSHRIGGTYENGEYVLTAPISATYLILSVSINETFACKVMSNDMTEMLTESGDSWEV